MDSPTPLCGKGVAEARRLVGIWVWDMGIWGEVKRLA